MIRLRASVGKCLTSRSSKAKSKFIWEFLLNFQDKPLFPRNGNSYEIGVRSQILMVYIVTVC